MIRRIFNLGIRTLASHIPPSGVKSMLYGMSGLSLGKHVHISHGVYIADGYRSGWVELKDEAVLSPYVVLVPSSHPNTSFIARKWKVSKRAKITIGKGAWIGAGAVILPGVTIGEGAIVGANAVCREDVSDYAIVGGVPAKVIGDVRDKEPISND
jgi:acetyltransferase-like isoleucine patch superfamily enzyme|tara:strand:- start:1605 stop:2069 length:465 start_codon:yes stop_codon:yes gene_type:complete